MYLRLNHYYIEAADLHLPPSVAKRKLKIIHVIWCGGLNRYDHHRLMCLKRLVQWKWHY